MRIALFAALLLAVPSAAQAPRRAPAPVRREKVTLRPFFVVTGQQFMAKDTFKAAFGSEFQPFWGGGVRLIFFDKVFVDVTASRFSKTGERAFRLNGQTSRLGIPVRVNETPLEFTAGYRFRTLFRRLVPYAGAGVGTYKYTETSDFADPGENTDVRHAGFVAVAGGEAPIYRNWIRLGVDVQYTYVSGILGSGGLSQAKVSGDPRESDLGGVAARIKVIVGK